MSRRAEDPGPRAEEKKIAAPDPRPSVLDPQPFVEMPLSMSLVNYLQLNPIVFLIFCTLIGLAVGSFLNVVVYRLPLMLDREWKSQCGNCLSWSSPTAEETVLNLSRPPSRCPKCGHQIRVRENIPVLSFCCCEGAAPPVINLYPCAILSWRRQPACSPDGGMAFWVSWEAAAALFFSPGFSSP